MEFKFERLSLSHDLYAKEDQSPVIYGIARGIYDVAINNM
jgi:hypothetical protein